MELLRKKDKNGRAMQNILKEKPEKIKAVLGEMPAHEILSYLVGEPCRIFQKTNLRK